MNYFIALLLALIVCIFFELTVIPAMLVAFLIGSATAAFTDFDVEYHKNRPVTEAA